MSFDPNSGQISTGAGQAPPGGFTSAPPLGPPDVDMMASAEMQAWIARLEQEDSRLGLRILVLAVALGVGLVVLAGVLWGVHRATVGAYAVLEDVAVTRNPANQGRLEFSFNVVSPGKVHYRRRCGAIETDVIDTFLAPGPVKRSWSWIYEPGEDIDVTLWCRSGLLRATHTESFPTADRADIVILIDTTGSMSRVIAELREKCVAFSERLNQQALEHRFALIGFGDAEEGPWLDVHEFTSDVKDFQRSVSRVKRFDGGDLPESALDALEEALNLPFDRDAVRRLYLVTDARFHQPTRSGATVADIAGRLQSQRVLLYVFSRRQYEEDYAGLLGETGRFQEIENFGNVLSEGRVLED